MGMLQSFASMPAAVFTGWIYDRTQSYTYALLPFIALWGLAALVLWQASRPEMTKRPKLSAAEAIDLQP
jgi:cyanate permease